MKAMQKTEELTEAKSEMVSDSESRKKQTQKTVSEMTTFYKKMEDDLSRQIRDHEKTKEEQERRKKELQD